jgi:hypothetical protein
VEDEDGHRQNLHDQAWFIYGLRDLEKAHGSCWKFGKKSLNGGVTEA